MGVPVAPLSTKAFLNLAKTITFKKGMPLQRMTYTPHPTQGRPGPVVRGYLEGNDPVTKLPILDEITGALTRPPTAEEKKTGFISRPRPRLLDADTPDNLQRLMQDSGWTDGLPVVLPTEERVAAMLKGTSHRPDEIVGTMRPSPPYEAWEYTVETVAVNAVMAGARPEHFPTILALASTGVTTLFSSTTSFARMAIVNGPVRNELNMNSGIGALGPFNESNAVIGRAWTLVSKNLSGSIPGETYMGSLGNIINHLNNLVPENEEGLPPGWKPLHVLKGFKPEESVVSVYTGWSLINRGIPGWDPAMMRDLLGKLNISGMNSRSALFLLDPLVAKELSTTYDTKEKFFDSFRAPAAAPAAALAGPPGAPGGGGPDGPPAGGPRAGGPGFGRGGGSWTVEAIALGGETNAHFQIGDFAYISSASIDKWK